nr:hypothetical protein [Chitinophagaceae bacterium]
EEVTSIAVNDMGETIMAGHFTGSLPTGLVNLSSSGLDDIFLVKYGNNGPVLWASKYGGVHNDRAQKVKLDKAKNIYITGDFETSTQIGDIPVTGFMESDILIARMDSVGQPVWAHCIGSNLSEIPAGIGIDKDTCVYVSGIQHSSLIIGQDTTEFYGNSDVFLSKFIQKDPRVYTFTGSGNWSVSSNWHLGTIPPSLLLTGDSIIIKTAPGDSCVLDGEQSLADGSSFIIDTNSHLVIIGNINVKPPDSTYTDPRDGKVYTIQNYGPQVWMTLNLNHTTSASVVYNHDENNGLLYGRLYEWEAAMRAVPPGWHIPSQKEWLNLIDYAGGANALKDTLYWSLPNTGATNSSGFKARAAGTFDEGDFEGLGLFTTFWTSTATSSAGTSNTAISLTLSNSVPQISWYTDEWKWRYLSVRCIKNKE